jgi:hypothetical protein
MTVRHPLALTDKQLRIVLAHVAAVPVQWRRRYLEAMPINCCCVITSRMRHYLFS